MNQTVLQRFQGDLTRSDRGRQNGHKAAVFWFTGLSGSGKSTIAHAVEKALFDIGKHAFVFDGDNVRHGLCADLSFTPEHRSENIRRIAETCKLFVESGTICLCAFISPMTADRQQVRSIVGEDYHEIHVSCPVEVCEARDVKGYYKMAREGKIKNYTGVSAPYEVPESPALRLSTAEEPLQQSVERTLEYILVCTKLAEP